MVNKLINNIDPRNIGKNPSKQTNKIFEEKKIVLKAKIKKKSRKLNLRILIINACGLTVLI